MIEWLIDDNPLNQYTTDGRLSVDVFIVLSFEVHMKTCSRFDRNMKQVDISLLTLVLCLEKQNGASFYHWGLDKFGYVFHIYTHIFLAVHTRAVTIHESRFDTYPDTELNIWYLNIVC